MASPEQLKTPPWKGKRRRASDAANTMQEAPRSLCGTPQPPFDTCFSPCMTWAAKQPGTAAPLNLVNLAAEPGTVSERVMTAAAAAGCSSAVHLLLCAGAHLSSLGPALVAAANAGHVAVAQVQSEGCSWCLVGERAGLKTVSPAQALANTNVHRGVPLDIEYLRQALLACAKAGHMNIMQ